MTAIPPGFWHTDSTAYVEQTYAYTQQIASEAYEQEEKRALEEFIPLDIIHESFSDTPPPSLFFVDRFVYQTEIEKAEKAGREFHTSTPVRLELAGMQTQDLKTVLSYPVYTQMDPRDLPEEILQSEEFDLINESTGELKPFPRFSKAISLDLSSTKFLNSLTALEYVPNLKELVLGSMELTGFELEELQHVKKLTLLDATNQVELEDRHIEYIPTHCPNLTTLKLNGCQVSDSTAEIIARLNCLSRLEVAQTPLTNEGIDQLAKPFSQTLTFLNIDGCDSIKYTNDDLFRLFPSLSHLKRDGIIHKPPSIPLRFINTFV